MEITQIKIRKRFDEGPLKVVFSLTFDDQLALHDCKLIEIGDRRIITMPNKKSPDGGYTDIAHPINAEFRHKIEEQVLAFMENTVFNN